MTDAARIAHRTALHDRYLQVSRVADASNLAYLHGPKTEWTEEQVAGLWQQAVQRSSGALEALNCLYIHVPFCKSICTFCNYDRLQPSSPELLKTWLGRALQTIETLSPAVRPLTFHAMYIGGGTPSVLPARLLRELLDAVDAHFTWHPGASRKLEFDPAVMNRERLEVLTEHGFDQLSFGIETLDPEINVRHNRGRQGIEVIERSFTDMRAVGIDDVACDFLLGLEGTTPQGMLEEMETILQRFRPAWVDIFMLTPTRTYVEQHFGGSQEAFWAHIKPFEEQVPPALPAMAARIDYEVRMGQGHHMMLRRRDTHERKLPPFKKTFSVYPYTALTSESRRPLNVLGLGRSARSTLFGTAAFASRDPGDSPWNAGAASYVGNALDMADEARTFLVHLLRDNDRIDRAEFRAIFGADMTELIPQALAGWEHEGIARLEDDALRFSPQDRRARTRSLLWLVPEEAIEFDLARSSHLDLTAEGIARLTESLASGLALAGAHTFQGAEEGRVLMRTPDGQTLRLRVAPALSGDSPLRLILETAPKSSDTEPLRRAVAQLRALLTRRHREMTSHDHQAPAASH